MSKKENRAHGRSRAINIFALVLDEIAANLGPEVSTEELMRAARYLVELSNNDYVIIEEKEKAGRANYFTFDVDVAFKFKQSQVVNYEGRIGFGVDECGVLPEVAEKIYRLRFSCDEMKWEY